MVSEPLMRWATETAISKGISLSELVRRSLANELERTHETEIETAAEALASMYHTDDELTAFTAIDGDDFHAAR